MNSQSMLTRDACDERWFVLTINSRNSRKGSRRYSNSKKRFLDPSGDYLKTTNTQRTHTPTHENRKSKIKNQNDKWHSTLLCCPNSPSRILSILDVESDEIITKYSVHLKPVNK